MRVAPAGLFYKKPDVFYLAAEFAAITHGHPSAGSLAFLIASILEGVNIDTAIINTLMELENYENHQECTDKLKMAMELAKSDLPDIEAITQLGEGWVGEEALAISVYSALKHQDDFKKALIAAVNHNGDSDSTGAITGNILGTYLGLSHIPTDWVKNVELNDVLIQIADDLLIEYGRNNVDWARYPGY